MRRFKKEKFPEFVFDYFYVHKSYDQLLTLPSEFNEQLTEYLRPYPDIAWVQFLRCRQYADAGVALKEANDAEKNSLGRKKVLLSLAKLSTLADNISSPPDIHLEHQMYVQRLQKTIFPNKSVPLNPPDLVREILFSSSSPVLQNVLSALDAAKNSATLIPSEERTKLMEHIWFFALEHGLSWNELVADWRNGRLEDSALEQKIKWSVIYGAASHPNNKGLLPPEMFNRVLANLLQHLVSARDASDEQFFSRILLSIYTLVLSLPACSV